MTSLRCLMLFLLCVLIVLPAAAQDQTGVVPDLTGLNLPQAAAELSKVGLLIGKQTPVTWTEGNPATPETIVEQAVAAGETLPAGSRVDLTIVGTANIIMIYDDNDFTMVNHVGRTLDLTQVTFQSSDGAASLPATRWRNSLATGECVQIWSVQRGTAKEWPECSQTHWFSTTIRTNEHFWTELNGVSEFSMSVNGEVMKTCPAALFGAEPVRCEFYLTTGVGATNSIDFLYINYTIGEFTVTNVSDDRWLTLNDTRFVNYNPAEPVAGSWFTLGSDSIFTPTIMGSDPLLLAPNQCVKIRDPRLADQHPLTSDCIVIGSAEFTGGDVFWQADFEVYNPNVGIRHTCPAAVRDKDVVCIMPRNE